MGTGRDGTGRDGMFGFLGGNPALRDDVAGLMDDADASTVNEDSSDLTNCSHNDVIGWSELADVRDGSFSAKARMVVVVR